MFSVDIEKELRDFRLEVSFKVSEGETLVLIGENGSGKSTILNLISGLLDPEKGEVTLNGEVLFSDKEKINIASNERNIGYLFQSYALFPHYTVFDNVAFGLRCRGMKKEKVNTIVSDQLKAMHLSEFSNIYAGSLSGGQKQRVALARALVLEPGLLLLDEPLAAVDVLVQAEMRQELRQRIKEARTPSLIVTHKLVDALELGDRIAIIHEGEVIQEGTPSEVFEKPESDFVARFTGMENILPGVAMCVDDETEIHTGSIVIHAVTCYEGEVLVGIRAEELIFSVEPFESTARNVFRGVLKDVQWNGALSRITADVDGTLFTGIITRQSQGRLGLSPGQEVYVSFKASAVSIFPR